MSYDYIIVGAGPTGLTLASLLPKYKTKLIIDKNSSIGGCHRVTRVQYRGHSIVTEHGPRVYSEAYINTKRLFKRLGLPFNFKPYKHQMTGLIGTGHVPLTLSEYCSLLISRLKNGTQSTAEAIGSFTPESKDFIERLCLLTDGAGPDRYPLHKLTNLINQQAFYTLLQPTKPMDSALFDQWKHLLEDKHSCTFLLNTEAKSPRNSGILVDGQKIKATQAVLLATVPWLFPELFDGSSIQSSNGSSIQSQITWNKFKYQKYISVMFWYESGEQILKDWGFPKSEWGIAYIELSDYWETKSSGTHLSLCITLLDRPSNKTGLTALQTLESEIPNEIIRQLSLPKPDFTHIYNHSDTAWIGDTIIGPQTCDPTVFSIGTHNGKSLYDFTSFESAVSNAMSFCDEEVIRGYEITDLLITGLTIFLIVIVMKY